MSDTPSDWTPPTPPPATAPGWGAPGAGPPPAGWGPPPMTYGAPPPVNKPGIVPLRPLGLSEILDGAFTLIRRYPRVTLGLSAVIAVLSQLLQLLISIGFDELPNFDPTGPDSGTSFGGTESTFTVAYFLQVFVAGFFGFVLVGMLTVVVSEAILGRRSTAGEVWTRIGPRMGGLLVVSFLASVLPYLGLIGVLVLGAFLWGKLALAVPAFVLEHIGPIDALRRSWRLVTGDFWRVWGIRALGWIIATAVSALLAIPFFIGALAAVFVGGEPSGTPVVFVVLIAIGSVVAQTIATPLMAAIVVLLYVDRRIRAEALDVALIAAVTAPPT